MFVTNIGFILSREMLIETNEKPSNLPKGYNYKENKALKDKEALLTFDKIKVNYNTFEEAVHSYETLKDINPFLKDLQSILADCAKKERSFLSDIKTGVFNVIVFFTDKGTDIEKIHRFEVPANFKIMISTDKNEAMSVGAKFPGIFCYNADEKNAYVDEFPATLQGLASAVQLKSFDKITQTNIRNFQTFQGKLIYFINNKNSYDVDHARFSKFTKQFTTKVKLIWFNPEDVPLLDKLLKLNDNEYPAMVIMDEDKKSCIKNVSEKNIKQGVQDLLDGKAPNIHFSSVIPEDNATRLIKVANTESLSSIRAETKTDKFILFSKPGCPHCKTFVPVLEGFIKTLKNKNIEIDLFDYNLIENEPVKDIAI